MEPAHKTPMVFRGEHEVTGRRIHERQERRLRVLIEHEGETFEAVTRNISLGGMYLITEHEFPIGSLIKLRFRLPLLKEDSICEVYVRWQQRDGVGVQFGSLRALEVWALNQLLKAQSQEAAVQGRT